MIPSRAQPPEKLVLGMLFMCLAATFFPIMNGLVQVLSVRYPSEQIVWARCVAHLIVVLVLFAPRLGLVPLIRTTQLKWQVVRSVVLLMSTCFAFVGFKYLELAKAAAISFIAPFIVTLLAWPMLGERISLARLVTVLVAFVGVVVVIRPGSDVFHWASLLALGSATCYALYQIVTRRVAGQDPPETSAVYSVLIGSVLLTFVLPFVWVPVQSVTDGLLLFALGIFGGLGHYCVARAMTYGPANILSPFSYWQMVGSVVVGYAVAGKLPDLWTWVGAGVIISAGLYMGWRETHGARPPKAPTPV